jgi:hypothetical protein
MLKDIQVIRRGQGREVFINGVKALRVNGGNSPTGGHSGMCKTVYFGDEFVVKFDDMSEAQMFIEEEDRPHFAEVVYADINREWYVQRRVNCVPNAEIFEEDTLIAEELAWKYGFGDVGDMDGERYGVDYRIGHNFTLDLNGRVVIYDYSG